MQSGRGKGSVRQRRGGFGTVWWMVAAIRRDVCVGAHCHRLSGWFSQGNSAYGNGGLGSNNGQSTGPVAIAASFLGSSQLMAHLYFSQGPNSTF